MSTMKSPWANIFENSNFGDKRRNARAIEIAQTVENTFTRSVNAAIPNPASLKATYRFMNSKSITPSNLLDGFMNENNKTITAKHVLLAEDTSELNFSWRKNRLKELGPVGNGIDQGFFLHPGIIIDPENQSVLGLAAAKFFVREYDEKKLEELKKKRRNQKKMAKKKKSKKKVEQPYKKLPIEEKESYRWLTVPQAARENISDDICMTVLADREGDIFDLFHQRKEGELGNNIQLLIRACRDRKLDNEELTLFDTIDSWPVKAEYTLKVNATLKCSARTAKMALRYSKITMAVPKTHSKNKFNPLDDIYVIDVREINPPEDEEPIHWRLLTTWPINTIEDALEKVKWYTYRWLIEELFRILKSGQQVEKAKFDSGHALMNWCALRLMMAVRLLHLLTHRKDENFESALPYFSPEEIQILEFSEEKLISEKSKIHRPAKKTLAWATLVIAIMGGYKATPSAKPPGQENLWRGMARLEAALIGFAAAQEKCG